MLGANMPPLDIRIDPSVADRLVLGAIVLEGIEPRAGGAGAAVDVAIRDAQRHLAALMSAADPTAREAQFGLARRLYKSFGIDPTKYRPSSEQLARRLGRG